MGKHSVTQIVFKDSKGHELYFAYARPKARGRQSLTRIKNTLYCKECDKFFRMNDKIEVTVPDEKELVSQKL